MKAKQVIQVVFETTKVGEVRGSGRNKRLYGDDHVEVTMNVRPYHELVEESLQLLEFEQAMRDVAVAVPDVRLQEALDAYYQTLASLKKSQEEAQARAGFSKFTREINGVPVVFLQKDSTQEEYIQGEVVNVKVLCEAPNGAVPEKTSTLVTLAKEAIRARLPVSRWRMYRLTSGGTKDK